MVWRIIMVQGYPSVCTHILTALLHKTLYIKHRDEIRFSTRKSRTYTEWYSKLRLSIVHLWLIVLMRYVGILSLLCMWLKQMLWSPQHSCTQWIKVKRHKKLSELNLLTLCLRYLFFWRKEERIDFCQESNSLGKWQSRQDKLLQLRLLQSNQDQS